MTIRNLRNHTATLLAATCLASASMLFPVEEARAWDCLLDTDNDGNADDNLTHRDTDGGANSGGQSNRLACGAGASAANSAAIAIGYISRANGAYSIAIGSGVSNISDSGPRAQVSHGISIGFDSKANGAEGSIGIGGFAVGGGAGAGTAIGYRALVDTGGANGTAIGANSLVTKETGVALGFFANATGANAIAIGGGSFLTSAAQAKGAQSISIGYLSDAMASSSIAIGAAANAITARAMALGNDSDATGADSVAIGSYSNATFANSVALGAGSVANAIDTVSVGNSTLQRRITNVAMGQDATDAVNVAQLSDAIAGIVPGTPYVAVNSSDAPAMATVDGATAVGPKSVASGQNASAFGNSSSASGGGATAVGNAAFATANRSTAIGRGSRALRADATAIGNGARAEGIRSTAIGNGATAGFTDATAIGSGATSTRSNQVTLGGAGSSVVVADIDASTAQQVGPVDVVTIDATGTLGRQAVATASSVRAVQTSIDHIAAVTEAQFDGLSGRVGLLEGRMADLDFRLSDLDERTRGGIAAAMAMGGPAIAPGKAISLSMSVANYRGEQALAGSLTGQIADDVYLSAGVSGNTADGDIGTRATVLFGF